MVSAPSMTSGAPCTTMGHAGVLVSICLSRCVSTARKVVSAPSSGAGPGTSRMAANSPGFPVSSIPRIVKASATLKPGTIGRATSSRDSSCNLPSSRVSSNMRALYT